MEEKVNIPKRILKSIRHIFGFGYFSSPPFFFLALILFLALVFKILYKVISSFAGNVYFFWIFLLIFVLMEVLVLLIFLANHITAYEFYKNKDIFKTSEFDKAQKNKNFLKKKGSLKGTIIYDKLSDFLVFSFYQGVIVMERPFWFIKVMGVVFKKAIKNKKDGFDNFYMWRKLYDDMKEKEYIYYPGVVRMNK
jgi:predicted membrane protein